MLKLLRYIVISLSVLYSVKSDAQNELFQRLSEGVWTLEKTYYRTGVNYFTYDSSGKEDSAYYKFRNSKYGCDEFGSHPTLLCEAWKFGGDWSVPHSTKTWAIRVKDYFGFIGQSMFSCDSSYNFIACSMSNSYVAKLVWRSADSFVFWFPVSQDEVVIEFYRRAIQPAFIKG